MMKCEGGREAEGASSPSRAACTEKLIRLWKCTEER